MCVCVCLCICVSLCVCMRVFEHVCVCSRHKQKERGRLGARWSPLWEIMHKDFILIYFLLSPSASYNKHYQCTAQAFGSRYQLIIQQNVFTTCYLSLDLILYCSQQANLINTFLIFLALILKSFLDTGYDNDIRYIIIIIIIIIHLI